VAKGGDNIEVVMRGIGGANNSQPALLHTKIIDRGDGSYICEFRPWLTGTFGVWITLDGCNITGSPYELSVITLRPDASRCIVRGDALHKAVARTPMKFEIQYVDAKGCPTVAEDLDVYIEPLDANGAEAIPPTGAEGRASSGRPSSRSPRGRSSGGGAGNTGSYAMLDAPTRLTHMQLWSTRMAADKRLAKVEAGRKEEATQGKKKFDLARAPTSYAHELTIDPLGFAFGGCDPGTLHAHGKIVKLHQVHYSVGLAGRYQLHVGLRHQAVALPGSPFELLVEPGKAYAASTRLPEAALPLSGVANEEWQHGLNFTTADMLGNVCTKGGSNIVMQLSRSAHRSNQDDAHVSCEVKDKGDGSYELVWKSSRAGVFPLDVLMDGAHVAGSPTELIVHSTKPAVEQMSVSGTGIAKAIAGSEAQLFVRIADRFGNKFEEGKQSFPYSFGLILNPTDRAINDKNDKKNKQVKGNEPTSKKQITGQPQDEKKAASVPFKGTLKGDVFEIRYVAEEAGAMDLHVWAQSAGDGEDRQPLPGSPFTVVVSEGNASAKGSFVGEAEASKQGSGFEAGEHIILRPMVRDPFGNPSTPATDSLTAELVKPGTVNTWEELPPPKLKGGLGSYEVLIEPIRSGTHLVYIKLDGEDITGSPVSFNVAPAAPSSSKCKLARAVPPENEPLLEKSPIAIIVTLFDKYGNQLDHGGVRVDAKASGVGVSGAKVEDNKDGTYTISLTAGPPGEVKVTVRIDGNDLPPYILTVVKAPETHAIAGGAADTSIEPVAAPEQSSPAAAEPKADEAEAKAKEAQRRQSQKPGETPKAADSSKGAEAAPPPAKE